MKAAQFKKGFRGSFYLNGGHKFTGTVIESSEVVVKLRVGFWLSRSIVLYMEDIVAVKA